MYDKKKKLTTFVATLCVAATAFAGCGSDGYSPKKLQGNIDGAVAAGENGGFVVEKGDFVYFINGSEDYTANNKLGSVKKGALMRISKADLNAKAYDKTETVVPSLFVAQDTASGIYLYGDYVYFASPTTEKNKDGSVAKSNLSFHRAKLDGSSKAKEIKDYFFRVEDNTVEYRFVEVEGVVYCMYVDNDVLYSYNTKTDKTYTLVENASSEFYFDKNDLSNPYVYYTMAVTDDIGTDHERAMNYNQVYSVRADVTAKADESEISYTTSTGYTYSFDKAVKEDDDFKGSDYATYPYVNLGELVLDGKGSSPSCPTTQYNHDDSTPETPNGYEYTLQTYVDGGAYFTRKDVNSTSSPQDGTSLYYVTSEKASGETWNTIAGNGEIDKVALNTTNASTTALYDVDADGNHSYIYTSETKIYLTRANADGTEKEKILLVPETAESTTLLKTDGKWLYFYSAGTNGNNLWRVDYTGEKSDYSGLAVADNYKAQQILQIDWNSSWYSPKFIGSNLFYSNAQSFGSTAYNYINVVDLSGSGADGMMTYDELKAFNEKYEEVQDYIAEFETDNANLYKAMQYYFRTGERTAYDEFLAEAKAQGYKDHYRYNAYEMETFDKFTKHTDEFADKFKDGDKYYDTESYFYNRIGEMKAADEKSIAAVWTSSDYIAPLPDLTEESSSSSKTVWLVVGITLGVLVVAAAIVIPVVIAAKKKAKLKADLEATRVRKHEKLDVTDDKSIDVYEEETDEAEESADTDTTEAEESVVESVETTVEETEE